jgi:hypothetical protein
MEQNMTVKGSTLSRRNKWNLNIKNNVEYGEKIKKSWNETLLQKEQDYHDGTKW